MSLVQSPPGTEKTITSATTVYRLIRHVKGKILSCASGNNAVDQLSEHFAMAGLRVVRLVAKFRESMSSEREHLSMHYQALHVGDHERSELKKLLNLRDDAGILMIEG